MHKADPGALARCPKCGTIDRPGVHLCKPAAIAQLERERQAPAPSLRTASHVAEVV